jgi:sugar phosphate isomerase/epimerase
MPQNPVLVEYSSMALLGKEAQALVERAKAACDQHGFIFGIQIHNITPQDKLEYLSTLGVPFSFHAPILSPYLMNLAAEDNSPALESLQNTVDWMQKLNVKLSVFHGFIMTDLPVPSFGINISYDEGMKKIFRPELGRDGSPTCTDFFSTDEYKIRFERVKKRLQEIRTRYPQFTFAIENDFPLYNAGNLLSVHSTRLDNPLCLDTSHLWASSFIFDRDYQSEVDQMLSGGNVKLLHLHASHYNRETPKTKWRDGHKSLTIPNEMNLPLLVKKCKKAGVRHFTLEISKAMEADIHAFAKMWKEGD